MGDFVGIGLSVVSQFKKWPPMAETYSSIVYRPMLNLLTYNGDFLGGPFPLSESSHHRPVPVSRVKLVRALYDYATSLRIPVIFDRRVVDYEESDNAERAYAITDKEERFEADVVVAADGIGSKASKVMLGKEVKTLSSGYSIYRVTYPTSLLRKVPFLDHKYSFHNREYDYCEVYIGPKGTAIILVSPELTTWLLTHEVSLEASVFAQFESC